MEQLQKVYGTAFKKRQWDCPRAREEELAAVSDQLLRMVVGSIGRKRRPDENVVITLN